MDEVSAWTWIYPEVFATGTNNGHFIPWETQTIEKNGKKSDEGGGRKDY